MGLLKIYLFLNSIENLNTEEIIHYTNETGYSTYNFKFNNSEDSINFENLHILDVEGGGYIAYILSFEPNEEWYYNNLNTDGTLNFNIASYQGEITKFSLEREVIWSTKESAKSYAKSGGNYATFCVISPPAPCDEGNHSDGQGWSGCIYSNGNFTEVCQTVWVSGGGSNTGGYDGDSSGTGGGSSSEECNDTSGTSIAPDYQPGEGITSNCTPNNNNGVSTTNTTDEIFIDQEFKDNPCLNSVYEDMGKASTFQGYLENFEPEFSVAHLRFRYDENYRDTYDPEFWGALAITEPPVHFNINITFNGDFFLEASIHNKPKLIIAVAFIHEMIHAETFRKMLSAAQQGDLNAGQFTIENRVNYINSLRNNFPGIYDYYIERFKPNWSHQQMAQHYRNIIVSAISEYDNNQHTQEVYEALAWIGLEDTIAWNNLPQSETNTITQTRTNFEQNDTDKCD